MGLMDFFKKGKEEPIKNKTVSPPPVTNVPPASPAQREYTVKAGDSLSKIAKTYYGNANDWKKIYEANKDVIKDPNLIYPGQKINIP